MSQAFARPDPITVTVIVATYNRAHYLRESLASILAQTRPAEQIIVVDDGSTDDTAAVLAEFRDRVEVLEQDNRGKPESINRALKQARGSHAWIFDDDDLALDHALATQVDFLAERPDIDFAFSRNYAFDGDGDIRARYAWRRGAYRFIESQPLLLALLYECELIFQALLVPVACFRDLGYFDPVLTRAQDYDMLIKLARSYRGGFNEVETMVWRDHSGERGAAGARHAERDRTYWFRYYERRIFTRVWNDFALAEYLPSTRGDNDGADPPAALVQKARLQRSEIMFRHDLVAYAGADLAAALGDVEPGSATLDNAKAVIRRAANVGDPVFVATATARARHLARAIGGSTAYRELAGAALKGFYWSIEGARRKQRPRDLVSMIAATSVFVAALGGARLKRAVSPTKRAASQT